MSFINPLILIGALGIALPILAHLLNKHQFQNTQWAAMQFLNRAVRVRSRQIQLRDLLLLLIRCLALLLLIFALSRPTVDESPADAGIGMESSTGVVIAIDSSYSMMHSEKGQSRFERAIKEVEAICENITIGNPISLVLLGDEHKTVIRNTAYHPERFRTILDKLEAQPVPLKMEAVSSTLLDIVRDMRAPQKEVYIISDLQTQDWKESAPWFNKNLAALQAEAQTFILPVQGSESNLSVTELELISGMLRVGTVARYRATVHNHNPTAANSVQVKCLVDGITVESKIIPTIGPKSSQSVSFFVKFHNAGPVKIAVELGKDALNLDNVCRTVAHIRNRVSILSVEGKPGSAGLESFIAKALKARPQSSDTEDIQVRSVSWLALPSQNLSKFDLVILSDVPEITEAQAKQLEAYVKGGNGLIWFGGENLKAEVWNKRSKTGEDSFLLPATIMGDNSIADESGAGRSLDPTLPNHPVCRPLRSLPKDLLSEARFNRLHKIKLHPSSNIVLNLSDNESPLLVEHRIGRGQVFMFTTTSAPRWNNMSLTPVFPMLLQQLVTYLNSREFETAQLVGNSLALSYADKPDASDGIFETPSGETLKVPVRLHGNKYVALMENAREAGFYVARVSVQSPEVPIAVNPDTRESDVSCLKPADAQKLYQGSGVFIANTPSELSSEILNTRTGYEYWRFLMMLALIFLVADSLVASNLFKKKARA